MPTVTTAHQTTIANLYFALQGHCPPCDQFFFWTQAMADGIPMVAIARAFLASKDALVLYPAEMSCEEFVQALYTRAAGRPAQRDTVKHWAEILHTYETIRPDSARAAVAVDLVDMLSVSSRLRG